MILAPHGSLSFRLFIPHLDLMLWVHLDPYSTILLTMIRRSPSRNFKLAAGSRMLNIWNIWPPPRRRGRSRARLETFAIFFPCFISGGRTSERTNGGRRRGGEEEERGNDEITSPAANVRAAVHSFSFVPCMFVWSGLVVHSDG